MTIGEKVIAFLNRVPAPVAACFRGDSLLTRRILRPVINRLVPAGPTWIVVRSGAAEGIQLLIYPKTEKLFWPGRHEVPVQEALVSILKPGMIFWDVGAHVGFFTLPASRLVGDTGHVHAFEAVEQTRERLLAGVQRNGCRNVTVHAVAVAAVDGEAMLYAHRTAAMWTLVPERGQQQGMVVPCCTLDEIARSAVPPDLIKIDVEGAEVDVLRGGLHVLSTARPRLIVEFSNDDLLAEARVLLPFYTFERLAPNHWLAR